MKNINKPSEDYSANFLAAVKSGDAKKALRILLIHGDKKDFKLTKDNAYASCGWTALHFATYQNNTELMGKILECFPKAVLDKTAEPWRLFFGRDTFFGIPYREKLGFNGRQSPLHLAKTVEAYKILKDAIEKDNSKKMFFDRDALGNIPKRPRPKKEYKEEKSDNVSFRNFRQEESEADDVDNYLEEDVSKRNAIRFLATGFSYWANDKEALDEARRLPADQKIVNEVTKNFQKLTGGLRRSFSAQALTKIIPRPIKEKLSEVCDDLSYKAKRFGLG